MRKKIGEKKRLQILQRDNFKCVNCGKSPAIDPFVILEVDHIDPHSKGGSDDISNLRTLCMGCNRGKGSDENLNQVQQDNIKALLHRINPLIVQALEQQGKVSIVANSEDYSKLSSLNQDCNYLILEPSTNTIIGFQAMKSLGIYTVNDNHGSKTHFFASLK